MDRFPEGERLRLNDWGEPAAWVLAAIAALAGLFLLIVTPDKPSDIDGIRRVILALIWFGFGLIIAGGARSGLIVDDSGITVQGWIRRRRWNWSEVSGFELRRTFIRQALRITLVSGEQIGVTGFGAKSSSERDLAEARVAELNRRCQAAGAAVAR